MATKPTDLDAVRWLNNTTAASSSVVVNPTSGTKDNGFVAGAKGIAQYFNNLFRQLYLWMVWLDAFESDAHTWAALQTFNSGVTATHIITAEADIRHATRKIRLGPEQGISPTAGLLSVDVTFSGPPHWAPGTGNVVLFPIPCSIGDRITEVKAYVKGGAGSDLTMQILKVNGTQSAPTQVTTAATTSGSGDQLLTVNAGSTPAMANQTVATGEWYMVYFKAGATTADQRIYAVEVSMDRVA